MGRPLTPSLGTLSSTLTTRVFPATAMEVRRRIRALDVTEAEYLRRLVEGDLAQGGRGRKARPVFKAMDGSGGPTPLTRERVPGPQAAVRKVARPSVGSSSRLVPGGITG